MTNDINSAVNPQIVSMFSGCGGLDLGFHHEGYKTIWANDFSQWACDSFRNYFGDVIRHEDITKIDPYTDETIPDCDIILGGFPCQGFSVANMNRNIGDERNQLYKQLIRVIDAKKPKFFLAENVKGIFSLAKGQVLKMILDDFCVYSTQTFCGVCSAARTTSSYQLCMNKTEW